MAEAGCLRSDVTVQNLEVLGTTTIAGNIKRLNTQADALLTPADLNAVHAGAVDAQTGINANADLKLKVIKAYLNLPTMPAAGDAIDAEYARRVNDTFGTTLVAGAAIGTADLAATANQVKELDAAGDVPAARIQNGVRPSNQFQVYRVTGDGTGADREITLPAATVGQSLLFLFSRDARFPDGEGAGENHVLNIASPADLDNTSFLLTGVTNYTPHSVSTLAAKGAADADKISFAPTANDQTTLLGIENGFLACTCTTIGQWHFTGCFGTLTSVGVTLTN